MRLYTKTPQTPKYRKHLQNSLHSCLIFLLTESRLLKRPKNRRRFTHTQSSACWTKGNHKRTLTLWDHQTPVIHRQFMAKPLQIWFLTVLLGFSTKRIVFLVDGQTLLYDYWRGQRTIFAVSTQLKVLNKRQPVFSWNWIPISTIYDCVYRLIYAAWLIYDSGGSSK